MELTFSVLTCVTVDSALEQQSMTTADIIVADVKSRGSVGAAADLGQPTCTSVNVALASRPDEFADAISSELRLLADVIVHSDSAGEVRRIALEFIDI